MKKKTIIIITTLALSIMLFAANGFADIPAPPVNQKLAMPDTVMNDLVEAECRACHENNQVDPTSIPDRHHLLYGSPIQKGECNNSGTECLTDADCAELDYCRGQTAASDPLASPGVYNCGSCHEESTADGVTNFLVERDCLVCHVQIAGEASVHHLTATAQGTDSPLGDPDIGDCTPCHGSFVDDYGDDAYIPTYAPSLVTPTVREGTADEINIEGNRAGGCVYCHSSGTGGTPWDYIPGEDIESGVAVYKNGTLHHTAGVDKDRYGNEVNGGCELCHGNPIYTGGDTLALRNCEQCHGLESLHNIQADSPNAANLGEIVVGGEDYGYGHIGIDNGKGIGNSDCWGCHGFGFNASSAPGAGPITPSLSNSDKQVILTGTDTTITLSGSSLTNTSGDTEYKSIFTLTSQDGSVKGLTPEQIESSSATLTIPGTTLAGNYKLRAAKMGGNVFTWITSNPVSISIKEPLIIESQTMSASCGECSGEVTITGSGFGNEADPILLQVIGDNIIKLNIISWTDTKITATEADCDGSEITINGFSATN
jgi:hypothetical protein